MPHHSARSLSTLQKQFANTTRLPSWTQDVSDAAKQSRVAPVQSDEKCKEPPLSPTASRSKPEP